MSARRLISRLAFLVAALPLAVASAASGPQGGIAGSIMSPVPKPVAWMLASEPVAVRPGGIAFLRIRAIVEPGWHLYALAVAKPIIPTSIRIAEDPAIESVKIYQPAPETAFDPNFGFEVGTYRGQAVFLLELRAAKSAPAGVVPLELRVRFQTCNDKLCLPPKTVVISSNLTVDPNAPEQQARIPADYTLFDPSAPAPVAKVPQSGGVASSGLGLFLLAAFGLGFAAVFTPCCFPMVPITVSYFLKKPERGRAGAVSDAVLFSAGIVVLFTALGLLATALLGPFGVVQLGSNVWVNAFIALVFLVFGLSLLGAYEITIPSSVLTTLDRASQGGGLLGTLLMGLTFTLTSFACVGPFAGTLLAASAGGGGARPVVGMAVFAAGLATPFFLLALFPAYLKRLPRAGGWMERIKVVMGFLVLAAMLKYLSAIDQVMRWNFLTRDRFLAAWIVLFALPGLYLLGLLKLGEGKSDESPGVARLIAGAMLLIFSISLIPGMFGARLGELDAYVPAAASSVSGLAGQVPALDWMTNRYQDALVKARQENRRVLVSFSGYACTNCHWMKANMFTRPEIAAVMKDYVLVELFTDGADAASRENQALQQSKFATVAIPYYAILDPDGHVIASFPGLTRNPQEFLSFLRAPTVSASKN